MDIRPIRDHLFPALEKLREKAENNLPALSLISYLEKVRQWYHIWNDEVKYVSIPMEERIQMLGNIAEYFKLKVKNNNTFALARAPRTLEAVAGIWGKFKWPAVDKINRLGHFGTNIVENHFSQIRMKNVRTSPYLLIITRSNFQHYVSLRGYFQIAEKAYVELVKRNCADLPFAYPQTEMSKCYNNQVF